MSLSTDMLATFLAVAEQLSVSGAARALGLPKSVVSKRLAQLEDSLGATLLARSTRSMALTPAGLLYVDFARRALDAVEDARESLRTLRTELSGVIRISAPVAWGQRVLGPLLPEFLAEHDGLEMELVLSDRVMDLAYERIDLAMRMSAASAPDLVVIPLVRLDWGLFAAPSYLARSGVPDDPAELARHRCLSYWRDRRQDRWAFSDGSRQEVVLVSSRYRANDPEAVADAAVAGLGIALLPLYFVEREIGDGRLLRLLPAWTPQTDFGNAVNVVTLPDRIRFARNQALLQFLRARLSRPG